MTTYPQAGKKVPGYRLLGWGWDSGEGKKQQEFDGQEDRKVTQNLGLGTHEG